MPRLAGSVGHALVMAPRIDPALPLVWRSPTTLQLGSTEARVVVPDAGAVETGLITALRSGASVATLRTIGGGLGASPAEVDRLLDLMAPGFAPDEPAATPSDGGPVVIDATEPLAQLLASALSLLGHDVVTDLDSAGIGGHERVAAAVIATNWVVSPARHLPWLRRDVPHLAIVFDESGVRVGPFVEPGQGPCLRCVDLARRDADAAWPVIAAQLAGRPAATATIRAAFDAASLAAALVDDRVRHGTNLLADGSIAISGEPPAAAPRRHPLAPHAECGCRAPGGTATAPVPLDARRSRVPSSRSSGAVPA
jgi:bacteriocin biosynthesis cyclodehydratase domain-containing protein